MLGSGNPGVAPIAGSGRIFGVPYRNIGDRAGHA